jgi:hypothetical protein
VCQENFDPVGEIEYWSCFITNLAS